MNAISALFTERHETHSWSETRGICEMCGAPARTKRARERCAFLAAPGDLIRAFSSTDAALILSVSLDSVTRRYCAHFIPAYHPYEVRESHSRAHTLPADRSWPCT